MSNGTKMVGGVTPGPSGADDSPWACRVSNTVREAVSQTGRYWPVDLRSAAPFLQGLDSWKLPTVASS